MDNLLSPRWMFVKAVLFVVVAVLAAALVLVRDPSWTTAACLLTIAWAAARAYYFVFYVVEKYVDPSHRFAGLGAFAAWWLRRQRARSPTDAPDAPR